MVQQHHLAGVTRQLQCHIQAEGYSIWDPCLCSTARATLIYFHNSLLLRLLRLPVCLAPASVESALYCFCRHEHAQFRYCCKNRKKKMCCAVWLAFGSGTPDWQWKSKVKTGLEIKERLMVQPLGRHVGTMYELMSTVLGSCLIC